MHLEELVEAKAIRISLFQQYRRTLQGDRRELLERFHVRRRRSQGRRRRQRRHPLLGSCLLLGRDDDDPLILQVKEAGPSVLEPYLGASGYGHGGHRVVEGQRLTQAASDIFLGWMTGEQAGRHFYWRQLRDMKGSSRSSG